MSARFTPGPWRSERRERLSVVLQSAGKDDGYSNRVAECPQWSPAPHPQPTPDEAWANANLIAAAPDLYEALSAMLRAYGNEAEEVAAHRAAESVLARARGEQP